MSGGMVFHNRVDHDRYQRWLSVKSHVLGQMGIKESQVGTAENFVRLANQLYGLSMPWNNFPLSIDLLFQAINGLSKSARRKLRKKNGGQLGYEIRPHSVKVKRAASEARQAKTQAYQKKHLVLVTSNGDKLFDNVREHSSPMSREEFYHSWEWRTLRMKIIKQFNRRCMCCGASPEDVTISGAPIRLVVDHIKPIANYWHLRLVPTNLQILCDECNMGKGAWDETDHRSDMERQIAEQLRDRTVGGPL